MPDRRRDRATRGQTRGRFSGEGGLARRPGRYPKAASGPESGRGGPRAGGEEIGLATRLLADGFNREYEQALGEGSAPFLSLRVPCAWSRVRGATSGSAGLLPFFSED